MCEYSSLSETPFYKTQTKILAPYAQTPSDVIREMLRIAKAKPGELLIDLGCGEGDVLIIAASEFGCSCIGYEIDDVLVNTALNRVKELGLDGKVKIIHDDLFNADISNANIVFLYLTPRMLGTLKTKLERELKKGARVLSHDYPINGWYPKIVKTIKRLGLRTHTIFLYVIE